MYIYPDEYLQLIDSIHDLQLRNEGYRADNITLGQEILRQRNIMHSYQKENLCPQLATSNHTLSLPSKDAPRPIMEKKVPETPKKSPSQNRIPLNEVLEYLNESERKVCNQISQAVEANNQKLIEKINQIKLKESRKTNKSSSSASSLKNREFNELATQMKALYKIWMNAETQPSNTELLQWINNSNAEVKSHSQQISTLMRKMEEIASQKISHRSLDAYKRNSHNTGQPQMSKQKDQHKISINIKSPTQGLKKKSILKRQSLLNKKKQSAKSKKKDPKVLIKDSKKSKIKDSSNTEKSKPKKQFASNKKNLLGKSKMSKKSNDKSLFVKSQSRQSKIAKMSKKSNQKSLLGTIKPRQSKISKFSKISAASKISKTKLGTPQKTKKDDKIISKSSLAVSKKVKNCPPTSKRKVSKKKQELNESRFNESYIISECGEANFRNSQWLNEAPL